MNQEAECIETTCDSS